MALRGDAPPSARVFPITERRINQLIKAAAKRAKNLMSFPPGASTANHQVRKASHAANLGPLSAFRPG